MLVEGMDREGIELKEGAVMVFKDEEESCDVMVQTPLWYQVSNTNMLRIIFYSFNV